ncbi:MAG TPA: protein translocase subunit SecF [Candidatus Avipropionibacterium avicola]|uniref:Protein-export membrane protein SecF n=1 Tax=Candidatus Avipropionibacterium avicola TaxID=2840701 RepID=A0A9D1GZ60_9ACTN|nr:protein translocase subunit SecF [Candidatus Avipropionibacterium avicola]
MSFPFIEKQRVFYVISAVLILASIVTVAVRGINFGIEFLGGADFQVATTVDDDTVSTFTDAVTGTGLPEMNEVTVRTIGDNRVRIQTRTLDSTTEVPVVQAAIAEAAGVEPGEVAYSLIGASWGGQITQQALIALGVFLVLVCVVIAIYFRNWKMSVAAMIALLHDLVLTVGIYGAVGFVVTPASVIGVLTILGYSLYDTVVVFDKVRENTRNLLGQTTRTYAEASNLAVNQVFVRSVNTTIIGVLPVAALLIAGVFILGEGPLKDLALALFVGMLAGAYSSLAIATPLLVRMVEWQPEIVRHNLRVIKRRASARPAADEVDPDDEDALVGASAGGSRSRALKDSGSRRPQPTRSSRASRKGRRGR